MKLFNSYLELEILVEEALRKFAITAAEYDEIMRVAEKDGQIDNRREKLLSRLKKAFDSGVIQKATACSS